MEIIICDSNKILGQKAAQKGAEAILTAILEKGFANIILATGSSQFETLNGLLEKKSIDWSKVNMFHLDEYIGIYASHPASFRKYLNERFISKVNLKSYHLISGEGNINDFIENLNKEINNFPIDVAFVGIGENGHLAFNDPPADFETNLPYIIVNLDIACRQQQVNEGWFESLDQVPTQAISMSINHILKSKIIICSVPDSRKAQAVYNTVNQIISPDFPASILRNHPHCELFLDKDSVKLLN